MKHRARAASRSNRTCRRSDAKEWERHSWPHTEPRQDLTGADRTRAARYQFNDVLLYSRTSKETGIEKGEYARVKSVDAPNNLLTGCFRRTG